MKQIERLSPVAKRAWKRLESGFPSWVAHLDIRDGELEFAVPAPPGSSAGHLVAFSHEDQLWVRFSPPNLCYPVDDENEMVSLIEQLTADKVVFKLVMKGDEWVETTLAKPYEKPESISGHSVRFVSWSGGFDSNCREQAIALRIPVPGILSVMGFFNNRSSRYRRNLDGLRPSSVRWHHEAPTGANRRTRRPELQAP